MKCPHCGSEIRFAENCPQCGQKIHYGGNTVLYKAAAAGKLTYKEIFSNVFKRHTMDDTRRSLASAPVEGMLSTWERPWLFARFFIALVLMGALLLLDLTLLSNGGYQTGVTNTKLWIIVSLIGPLTIALFLWEMDIHRQVNFINFLALVFFAGLIADFVGGWVNTLINGAAWTAGLTEETTKLLVSLAFILIFRRKGLHCLDGLAIGAAVGAGFAFWENILYVMQYGPQVGSYAMMALWRSFWGLLGSHMLYTAPCVGALCYAVNGGSLEKKHFTHPLFLTTLAFGMGAHALNNADWTMGKAFVLLFGDVSLFVTWPQIFLAIFAWAMLLYMLRRGVRQALETDEIDQAVRFVHTSSHEGRALICRQGKFAGNVFSLEAPLVIGRQRDECNLILENDSVSRKHCAVYTESDKLCVRDLNSSNGTFVNGKKIVPNTSILLSPGDVLKIGSDQFEVT